MSISRPLFTGRAFAGREARTEFSSVWSLLVPGLIVGEDEDD